MTTESPRKTPYGLIVSIALNGLLVGLLAGVLLAGGPRGKGGPSGHGPGPGGPGGMERSMARAILQSAPQADRAKIRRTLGDAWKSTESDRRVIRDSQRIIAEQVRSDTFDSDDVAAAFAAWRDADRRIKTSVQTVIVEVLDSLPAESRRELAEEMDRRDAMRKQRGERLRERVRERMEERRENREN